MGERRRVAENLVGGALTGVDDRRRLLAIGVAAGAVLTALIVLATLLLFRGDDEIITAQPGGDGVADSGSGRSDGETAQAVAGAGTAIDATETADGTGMADEAVSDGAPLEVAATGDDADEMGESAGASSPGASNDDASEANASSSAGSLPDAAANNATTTTAGVATTANTATSERAAGSTTVTTLAQSASTASTRPPTSARPPTTRPATSSTQPNGDRSIAALERSWAADRRAVVDRLNSGDYGVGTDNILRGPGGLRVDLNACPSGWDDFAGLENGTISIALTSAQSGNLAAYGNIGVGMGSYFDYVNENGGIDGRRLELVIHDDSYLATVTIDLVEQILAGRQPLAVTTLGTPNSLAVYDRLNDQCVPQPFVISGHPAWAEAREHPFTMGLQMSYRTEAALWGEWIERNLADQLPVKVRSLVMDHDFGLAYDQSFSSWVRDNPGVVSDYQAVRHDAAAPTVTKEMTTIEQADPDVFISMTAGTPCLLAMQEAGSRGLTPAAVGFTPSVCRDELSYMAPAGGNAEGFLSVTGGVRETNDSAYARDPFAAFVNKTLRSDGLDSTVSLYGTGFALYGWTYVEALRIAAELEGGLSRSNLLLAMWSLNLEHPMAVDGMRLSTSGQQDPYPIEGSDVERWDAAGERWVPATGTVDINGKTAACSWRASVGC